MPSESGASSKDLSFRDLIGKKILIVGEVGSGKTRLTARLLDEAAAIGLSSDITVIDMAPTVKTKSIRVGGLLAEYSSDANSTRTLRPRRVHAPRLEGSNREEMLQMAKKNARAIGRLLEEYLKEPSKILFINDVTLFLHAGSLNKLASTLRASETCVVNGYKGKVLKGDKGSGISKSESEGLSRLMKMVDMVVDL